MQWLELKIDAAPAGLEPVSALLEDLGITGLVIDDEGDFQDFLEHNHAYWDYVDDQLMQEKKGLCRITFYLEDSPDGYNTLADVIKALASTVRPLVKEGGIFLCSGIIDDRAEEVAQCLRDNGWTIAETRSSEGWFSYLCR